MLTTVLPSIHPTATICWSFMQMQLLHYKTKQKIYVCLKLYGKYSCYMSLAWWKDSIGKQKVSHIQMLYVTYCAQNTAETPWNSIITANWSGKFLQVIIKRRNQNDK